MSRPGERDHRNVRGHDFENAPDALVRAVGCRREEAE